MTFKDRFRRLRKSSPTAPAVLPSQPTPTTSSPANVSPGTRSTTASTGQATPAATQTPTAGRSSADLPDSLTTSPSNTATITNPSTIQEALIARAATNASQTNGDKKKRRGLFRRKEDPYKDWPEDVYKPHEVPPPKYKRTPDPKHIENLSAFSFGAGGGGFGKLVRRFSQQSGVSPGGSKWQSPFGSRAGSRVGSRAPSRLASAAPSADPSRNPSIAEDAEGEKSGVGSPSKHSRPSPGSRGVSTKNFGRGITMQAHDVDRVAEEEGEGDIRNVGMMSRPRTAKDDEPDSNGLNGHKKTDSKSSHDMPFTEQELTQALTKATLENSVPKIVDTPPA